MLQNENSIVGTIAELVADNRLTINGVDIGQPELSVLTRLGFGTEVGKVERPEGKRGPAAKIWELPLNGKFAVALK